MLCSFQTSARTLNNIENWGTYKILRYIYHLYKIFYSFENIFVSFCPKNMILDVFWRVIIGVQKTGLLRSSNLKTERPRLQVQSFAVLVQSSCSLFAVLRLDFKALINCGHGQPVFRICGELCHRSGALVPSGDKPPQYAQLYVYEPRAALQSRMAQNQSLSEIIMHGLQDMLLQHHQYAPVFKHAHEILCEYDGSIEAVLYHPPHNPQGLHWIPLDSTGLHWTSLDFTI